MPVLGVLWYCLDATDILPGYCLGDAMPILCFYYAARDLVLVSLGWEYWDWG